MRNPPAIVPAPPRRRRRRASAWRARPDRAARSRRTATLPTAAIPRAALADPLNPPRHRRCVFPPGLPWHGLLLPLTRFHLLGRQIRRGDRVGSRLRRTLSKIQRRERLFLVQLNRAFPDQFQRSGKA